ncbi:pyridoxamine 5'-phosphate oxidase family protein [Spongisporangium articulatum]|uniref:Pyridoxamine 5'-phosphate oxidase family protein n=1 Tax=Spongisporangium articulatum TaxID=3362603 RepID=A0ABW8AM47_9ACTN
MPFADLPAAVPAGQESRVDGRAAGGDRTAQELSRAECLRLLRTTGVGRLVYTDRALPAIIPVNFVITDDHVVVALRNGSRAAQAANGNVVAFEADRIDEETRTGWSVVVVGPGVAERVGTTDVLLRSWITGERDVRLLIALQRVTGRRLLSA